MELGSQTKLSGSSAKPRATSLERGLAADRENHEYGANATNSVGLPSSPAMTTRDGKLASHTHPVRNGRDRASIPSARSESAGSVVGYPEGSPPRRQGKTRESGHVGEAATRDRWSPVTAEIGGGPSSRDENSNLTLVPGVESLNRGSGLPLAYASGLSPPSPARRESTVRDVSHSTMLTTCTCADPHTRCVETHTTATDLTSTKQSAQASFATARADIEQPKDLQIDLKVDRSGSQR